MTSTVITNIGELVTNDGPVLSGAALVVESGRIAWVGPAASAPAADNMLDAEGRAGLPGFVDSHTHLVFAGDRAGEFVARMAGEPYASGGIRSTVAVTRAASDEELRGTVARLAGEALRQGTTTIEIKSGYGLSVADEARSLRIAGEFTPETTFLGAHVVPASYSGRADEYVALVCGEMLEAAAPYARWVDVFCEPSGAFDADQTRAVLAAGLDYGLTPRVHANQLGPGPGVQLAVELGCASADHCTYLSPADVDALAGGETVATFLPATDFSTRQPYPDARRVIEAGATVAIATNCNPGSSNTTSMSFCIALAVRDLWMSPEEALAAATAGGAAALGRTDVGRLGPGARADAVVLDAPSFSHLVYRPGVPLIAATFAAGRPVWRDEALWPTRE
jgi:imidazolonepropionase